MRADTPFNFCVIDEVDSILVDEARTPLIISGPSDKPSDKYYKVGARGSDEAVKNAPGRPPRQSCFTHVSTQSLLHLSGCSAFVFPSSITLPAPATLQAAKVAEALTRDVHYTVDEKQKSVLLTEDGYEAVEDVLQVQ